MKDLKTLKIIIRDNSKKVLYRKEFSTSKNANKNDSKMTNPNIIPTNKRDSIEQNTKGNKVDNIKKNKMIFENYFLKSNKNILSNNVNKVTISKDSYSSYDSSLLEQSPRSVLTTKNKEKVDNENSNRIVNFSANKITENPQINIYTNNINIICNKSEINKYEKEETNATTDLNFSSITPKGINKIKIHVNQNINNCSKQNIKERSKISNENRLVHTNKIPQYRNNISIKLSVNSSTTTIKTLNNIYSERSNCKSSYYNDNTHRSIQKSNQSHSIEHKQEIEQENTSVNKYPININLNKKFNNKNEMQEDSKTQQSTLSMYENISNKLKIKEKERINKDDQIDTVENYSKPPIDKSIIDSVYHKYKIMFNTKRKAAKKSNDERKVSKNKSEKSQERRNYFTSKRENLINLNKFKQTLLIFRNNKYKYNPLVNIFSFLDNKDRKECLISHKIIKLVLLNSVKYHCEEIKRRFVNLILNSKLSLVEEIRFKLAVDLKSRLYVNLKTEFKILNFSNKEVTIEFFNSIKSKNECKLLSIIQIYVCLVIQVKDVFVFEVKNVSNYSYWVVKENTDFFYDNSEKAYSQTIQNFKVGDTAFFSLNLISDNYIIDPSVCKFGLKTKHSFKINDYYTYDVTDVSDKLKNTYKYYNNINSSECDTKRFCELELLKTVWTDIENFNYHKLNSMYQFNEKYQKIAEIILNKINIMFQENFSIKNIYFCDIGYFIFKIIVQVKKAGRILKDKLGIELILRESNHSLRNEIKKNFLVYENCNILEMRVNDYLIFYISHNK